MIRINTFKAIDNEEACKKFVDGHIRVLTDYGVTKVTSARGDWMYNPNVYVVIAYYEDTDEVVGGVRVHVANDVPLPFETAVAQVDTKVLELVKHYKDGGTAELCGLWNAKKVAGMGLGIKYLMWAGIVLADYIGLKTMFALCAEHTLQISVDKGFIIERSLGNDGAFNYPKLDLVATCAMIPDLKALEHADPYERQRMQELREKMHITKIEESKKGPIEVEYDLYLKGKN